jgi:periplasmic protein CpxP/Spy
MSDMDDERPEKGRRLPTGWLRRVGVAGLVAVVAIGVGAAAATNGASTFYGPAMHVAMGKGGIGTSFAERRFERVMTEIEATDEQADRLRDIFEATRDELMPERADLHEFRDELAALIAAPEIDREAAERLRAEKIETIDRASRRMTDALIEAAEVLTPEQRAALIEKFEERRWHRRR